MDSARTVLLLILSNVLLVAVINDLREHKIPNWLTFPAMVGAVVFHTALNGWAGCLYSLQGIGLGMALLLVPYLLRGMGAGDVKLLGAVGGFLGPQGVFRSFLFIGIVGGIYVIAVLAFQGTLKETLSRYWRILKGFISTLTLTYIPSPGMKNQARLPYGVAIALGTLLSVGLRNHIFLPSVF